MHFLIPFAEQLSPALHFLSSVTCHVSHALTPFTAVCYFCSSFTAVMLRNTSKIKITVNSVFRELVYNEFSVITNDFKYPNPFLSQERVPLQRTPISTNTFNVP